MGIGRVGRGVGRNDVNTVYLREVCLTLLQPGSRQRCWTPCQVVKWFFSVVLSQSFLMTFTKENRDEDRLMVGSIRSLGYLVPLHLDPGVPFLLKGPWLLLSSHPLLQSWWLQRQKRTHPDSQRKGKLIMGFTRKCPSYAYTLSLPCARITHSTGLKKV